MNNLRKQRILEKLASRMRLIVRRPRLFKGVKDARLTQGKMPHLQLPRPPAMGPPPHMRANRPGGASLVSNKTLPKRTSAPIRSN